MSYSKNDIDAEEKIFCKKCKHFNQRRYANCNHPANLKYEYNWRTEWTSYARLPKYINKENNCKWFELSPEGR